ncbi:MAG: hypothetical protein N2439_14385, partial [Anaerolineae bacterium]|nr:hypothetical protein [Anaerolineae bacterium]
MPRASAEPEQERLSPRRRPTGPEDIPWRARARVLSLWLVATLLSIALLVMPTPFSGQVQLQVGDVAPYDVFAPRQVT